MCRAGNDWLFSDPNMAFSPPEFAFKVLPFAHLLDGSNSVDLFARLGLILDLQIKSILLGPWLLRRLRLVFLLVNCTSLILASLCQVHWLIIVLIHAEHLVVTYLWCCSLYIFACSILCDRSLWTYWFFTHFPFFSCLFIKNYKII